MAGAGLTVTTVTATHPPVPVGVKLIVAWPPDTAVTTPLISTVAIAVLLLLQVPVPEDRARVAAGHIAPLLPLITAAGMMVTVVVAIQPPVPSE